MDLLTPEQQAQLNEQGACPYWQTINPTGWCVEKWWSGGPAARLMDGLGVVLGMAVIGLILAEAAKTKVLSPLVSLLIEGKQQSQILRNPRRRRAGRGRRSRR